MILLTNGCSWTWGGALEQYFKSEEERLELVWPHHLGELLNAEQTINLASGCGSNQRIFRTTFDWIINQPRETLDNTIAVIQWTEYSRYEYYNNFHECVDYENDTNNWASAKFGCVVNAEKDLFNKQKIDIERALKRNNYRLETYTVIEGVYRHLQECLALTSLFKQYNIKHFYWNFGNQVFKFPQPFKQYFLSNFNWIDGGHCFWEYDRLKHDPHPSLDGHKQIAQTIYELIKNEIVSG